MRDDPRSLAERVQADGNGAVLLDRAGLAAAGLERCWDFWARPAQTAPEGDWRIWLILAGRGFGKTRAGAEWVRRKAREHPGCRIALIGATMAEARQVMVEGVSGLLAISAPAEKLLWVPSLGRLRWGNGTQARLFSAAEPEGLRGPEHHFAWADEVAKWTDAEKPWDNLMMTLRLGVKPQTLATTTPRPVPLIRRLLKEKGVTLSRGRTDDNRANLSQSYLAGMAALYGGTRLGRQELDGELIDDMPGALWSRALIERQRCAGDDNQWTRVVVGVDPPAGRCAQDAGGGDACGIVAVALDGAGCGHVIEDGSVAATSPEGWARAVAECAQRHGADRVVAEANNGGAMVRSVLLAAGSGLPVKLVHASRGKSARAEPVAALYEAGRAFHDGAFPALEDQMCGLVLGGGYEGPGRSPDRADALVWAFSELMLGAQRVPRVRGL
ncbi:DNA-packaging protein [Sphingomonas sp. C3-2]|uniref:DNA-packaging protein n=1 Tax=Sphingomonas sp. C3-2 TaxID=3062169 RepID=UPI00294B260C|nr:terminase family protein [Sphingomonas sp. C3-2]WOK36296.1 terminase family protein [Sphingomonas sp. C3-2]